MWQGFPLHFPATLKRDPTGELTEGALAGLAQASNASLHEHRETTTTTTSVMLLTCFHHKAVGLVRDLKMAARRAALLFMFRVDSELEVGLLH